MTSYTDGGDIKQKFLNFGLKKQTVKLTIEGTGYLYRKQIKDAFMTTFDLTDNDFLYVFKQDKAREWYVTLQSLSIVERILRICTTMNIDRCIVHLEEVARQNITLKVHWLPIWVTNELLIDYFGQFGEVVSVMNIWSAEAKVDTEMRQVRMIVDDDGKHNIPHIVRFNGGMKMLITCPGRMPICLKCNCLGHVRRDCAMISRSQSRSYADRLMNREFPTLMEAARATMQPDPDLPPPPPEISAAEVTEEPQVETIVEDTLEPETTPDFTPVEEVLNLTEEENMEATNTSTKHTQEEEEQRPNKKKKKTTHQAPLPAMFGENSVFMRETTDILSSPISPQSYLLDPGENI